MAPRTCRSAIPQPTTGLVPVAVDRAIEIPIEMVAIAPIAVHRAMTHAGRLKAVRKAAGLRRLHEGYARDRRGHNRPKNIPHEDTSSGGNSQSKHLGQHGKSHSILRMQAIGLLSTAALD